MDLKVQKMLAETVANANKNTVSPYTTKAEVTSITGDTVYVKIPGSENATPVKASSVSVKVGDIVDLAVSHSDTHITGNRSDVAVSSTTAESITQTMEASRLDMENELDIVGNKMKILNNNIDMQNNTINMQNNTITQMGNTIDQQNNTITQFGNTIEQQGNTITQLNDTVTSQGNTITQMNSTIETLDSTVETQGSNIETLNSTVETQGSTIETLNSTVETQGSNIETLNSTVETQGSTIETLNSTVETQGSTIETLDSTVETQGSAIQTLDSSIKVVNSAFVIQNGKLTGISEIMTNLLDSDYVTTDLLNADVAWIEDGKIKEGAIGTVEIHDSSITTAKIAELSADVIKTGTLKTECLILTTDEVDPETGEKKVALITALNAKTKAGEGNILDGAVIKDETIEAAKITVVDLNAFGATIGNFHIGTSSIYNNKTAITDPTDGVYIGTDGIALGQGSLLGMTDDSPFRVESDGDFHLGGKDSNYINFDPFKGELNIDAKNIKMGSSSIASVKNVNDAKDEVIAETKAYTDAVKIGGRNLYYLYDFSIYHKYNISKYDISSDGTITLYASGNDMCIGEILHKDSVWAPYNGPKMDISGATSVTYSISNPLFKKCFYNFLDESGKAMTEYQLTYASSAILKVPDGAKYLNIRIGYENSVAGTAYKLKIKVEKGNKATDWSPAPEDVEEDATTKANEAVTEAKSYVDQTAESITSTVSKTYATKTDLSTTNSNVTNAQSTANSAKTAAEEAKADVNSLTNRVTAAETKISQNSESISLRATKTEVTDAIDGIQIGGRNLARNTSSDFMANPYTDFNGGLNICPSLARVYTTNLKVGDTITVRLVYKYENIVPTDGKTASCYIQGSGDVTYWDNGAFDGSPFLVLNGSGEYIFEYSRTITEDHLRNTFWDTNIRHDYIQSGSVNWKCFKVEKGNKATDWTPAPEDVEASVDAKLENYATLEVTNNKIYTAVTETKTYADGKASDAVATAKSYTDQTAESISSTVEGIDGRMSKMEQNADGFTWTIDKTAIVSSVNEYYKSTSPTSLSGGSWSTSQPTWSEGTYIWMQTKTTNGKGDIETSEPVCITGNTGKDANQIVHSVQCYGESEMYMALATFKIADTYINTPIQFKITSRGRESSNVCIMFLSTDNTDPGLEYIRADGDVPIWIQKTAASTWRLICEKNEPYGSFNIGNYINVVSVSVTWTSEHLASVPSNSVIKADRLMSEQNASKVATNYMKFENNGLTVGNMTADTLGKNVLIDSDSVDIRNGSEVLASYGENISLYKNGMEAFTIKDSELLKNAVDLNNTFKNNSSIVTSDGKEIVSSVGDPITLEIGKMYKWSIITKNSIKHYIVITPEQTYNNVIELVWSAVSKNLLSIVYGAGTKIDIPCVYLDDNAVIDLSLNGSVWINNNGDLNGKAKGLPPLSIGTNGGEHLEIDSNEITAKTDDTTPSNLDLNMEGGYISVNSNYDRSLKFQGGTIYAKKLSGTYADKWLEIIDGFNTSNNTTFGYGNYSNSIGETSVYGYEVNNISKTRVVLKSEHENVNLTVGGDHANISTNTSFLVSNNKGFVGTNKSGDLRNNLQPCDADNKCVIGYDSYTHKEGATNIYGDYLSLTTNNSYIMNNKAMSIPAISVHSVTTQVLSTSASVIAVGQFDSTDNQTTIGSTYFKTTLSGVRCLLSGWIKVSAQISLTGLTDGDGVNLYIYKNSTEMYSTYARLNTSGEISIIDHVFKVAANDVIYIYARNITAARGTITNDWYGASLTIAYVN